MSCLFLLCREFLLWLSRLWTWLGPMMMCVLSLTLLNGLRICCCCELWCRLQTQLTSHIAVAVVLAGSYSSDSTPSLETSIYCRCGSEKKKRNNMCEHPFPKRAIMSTTCFIIHGSKYHVVLFVVYSDDHRWTFLCISKDLVENCKTTNLIVAC